MSTVIRRDLSWKQRRSIQGDFVRRTAQSGIEFSTRMRPETLGRISAFARYLLSL